MIASLTFARTRDADLVRSVVTDPAVFPFMFSDGGPDPESYAPIMSDAVSYVAVRIDNRLAGLFICVPQTSVCWEVHACLLPWARPQATEIYGGGLDYLKRWTACRKVIGYIPASNPAALLVAAAVGATVIGVNAGSQLKSGRLEDQIIVGKAL